MSNSAYITGFGAFLPGEPVGNDDIEDMLGIPSGGSARLRQRMLTANGIEKRHYALDRTGATTMLNEELAAHAIEAALTDRGIEAADVGLLAVGTTQPDLPVPGFASMVHGRIGGKAMETLSAGGVCASGMAAFRSAVASVRLGEHDTAVVAGSELVSRSLKASRLARDGERLPFDAEFLRWMLSDGAGAVVVESEPRSTGLSLRVEWSHLRSHAHRFPTCMYAGAASPGEVAAGSTWQDAATPGEADAAGLLNLRQDTRALEAIVGLGVSEYVELVRADQIRPDDVDLFLCHYSSEYFKGDIVRLMDEAGLAIPEEKWFSNLTRKGNTGAASIFIMLEEAMSSGRISEGDRVLLMVPESGRFTVSFVMLTAVAGAECPVVALAEKERDDLGQRLIGELAGVWADFEIMLGSVGLVERIESDRATRSDYRRLLLNLRQQVKEGSRWITRAASYLTEEYADLRAAFIEHAAEEQHDYRMLERDYVALGGRLEDIQSAAKNPGSEALSAFMFEQASQENPLHLMGAMFIIEGLGSNKASRWASLLEDQLDLEPNCVSFLRYHGEADDEHTAELNAVLTSDVITPALADEIVRTARTVARLYALQLEEVDRAHA